MEAMQALMDENEQKHKNEMSSLKKKLNAEMDELNAKHECLKKQKIELENNFKKLQQTNKVRQSL
jgi:hypothetical protein